MKKILCAIFPYVITLALWHLSGPRFNPFGFLSIIPVFYYTFCAKIKHFFPFGFLVCFLLDYNAGTLFLFSSAFLVMNAINSTFGIAESEHSGGFYTKTFNIFMGLALLMMFVRGCFSDGGFWPMLGSLAWLYAWTIAMYLLFAALFRRFHDR